MKKALFALIMTLLFTAAAAEAAGEDITVIVNGENMEFDVSPKIINDRTMVPMRAIFEKLGAEVEWSDPVIIAARDSLFVSLKIGSEIMIRQDLLTESLQTKIKLDSPPVIEGERTLVPVRAVSEALGAAVEWDPQNFCVIITTN